MSVLLSRLRAVPAAGAIFAAIALASPASAAAPSVVDLVFYAPHFAKVEDGSTLTYRFVRTAADPKLAPSFEDAINIKVGPQGAENSVSIELFSGARAEKLANMSKTGNPVIVALLEQDVKEMQKTLGGSPFYFRNLMRVALSEERPAEPIKFDYQGKSVDGWKVAFKPFVDDVKNKDKLKEFAQRSYELTFSDAVPGGLYALKSVTPSVGMNGSLLVEELTLVNAGKQAAAQPDAAQPEAAK